MMAVAFATIRVSIARMSAVPCRTMSDNLAASATYRNGPDQIIPATSIKTWVRDGIVKLRANEEEMKAVPPVSVFSLLHSRATEYPDIRALAVKRDGEWKYWTYKQYYDQSRTVAKAFIKIGLERFCGVCIMGANAPEWVIANFGAIFAGGLSTGVYPTSTSEACKHLADNCKAQILVVEDQVFLDRFLAIKDSLPDVKAIVQWSGTPSTPGVLGWGDVMDIGEAESEDALEERLSLSAINQCCYLTYTAGTTGPPKGVMCSQDNLTYVGDVYLRNNRHSFGRERLLSYLPLSHIAANIIDVYTSVTILSLLYFAEPDALKGSLLKTLQEVQPTGFFAVPRVWEKMYEGLQKAGAEAPITKRVIVKWAKYHGLNYYKAMLEHRKLSPYEKICNSIAKKFVLSKIKKAVGFGCLTQCVSGAAPIDDVLVEYFHSLDIPVVNVYGMSENITVCAFSYTRPSEFKPGSCGKVVAESTTRIKSVPGGKADEGELLMTGRAIFMGYLGMPEETNNTIDDDGWMHSGDVGRFDEDGFLHITARIKEIVITAGGENIPPVLIEECVKKELPFISNAMLVGDHRKYLSMLLTLKADVDENTGKSLPTLIPYTQKVINRIGSKATTVADAVAEIESQPRGKLATTIQQGIERYNNNHSISNAQKIQRWTLLPTDFSVFTGEYNNTLKLKRFYVLEKYMDVIDLMYTTPSPWDEV